MKTGRHVFMLFCYRGGSSRRNGGRAHCPILTALRGGPGGCAGQYRLDHLCHKMDLNSSAGRHRQSRHSSVQATDDGARLGRRDFTDALGAWKFIHKRPLYPRDPLLTGFGTRLTRSSRDIPRTLRDEA